MPIIQGIISFCNMFIVYQWHWMWIYISKEKFSNLVKALVELKLVKKISSDGVYLNSKIQFITTFLFVVFFNKEKVS